MFHAWLVAKKLHLPMGGTTPSHGIYVMDWSLPWEWSDNDKICTQRCNFFFSYPWKRRGKLAKNYTATVMVWIHPLPVVYKIKTHFFGRSVNLTWPLDTEPFKLYLNRESAPLIRNMVIVQIWLDYQLFKSLISLDYISKYK